MEYIGLIVLLYWGFKHLLQVIELVCRRIAHYRDSKQAIAKLGLIGPEYSGISEEDAYAEWLGFAKRHGISTEE